jgi:hypothetical protein
LYAIFIAAKLVCEEAIHTNTGIVIFKNGKVADKRLLIS